MKAGLKWSFRMSQTAVFKQHKLQPIFDKFNCGKFNPFSDEYFECFLRHWSHTIYHPAGTCKMGPVSDPMAVVDSVLKLHGIQNLRVIDASIMPALVGANTNAPSIMIGEKGSSIIIEKWGKGKAEPENKIPKTEL